MIKDVIILNMFEKLLSLWQHHRGLVGPPASRIQLWSEGGRGVWISEAWAPAVPYGPIDHEEGNENHGYMRIKGDAVGARRIPEAMGWPELIEFLDSLNIDASPIESVGCEKSLFPVTGRGDITVKLGAYIDVIFTDPVLNERPENIPLLASHLLPAVEGSAFEKGIADRLGLRSMVAPVRGCRKIGKKQMIHNDATPDIQVNPETYEVRVNGQAITCEPLGVLPLAQRYFLF